MHGDYLTSPEFDAGFALLAKHGLSFDLHCNDYQLPSAIPLLKKVWPGLHHRRADGQ